MVQLKKHLSSGKMKGDQNQSQDDQEDDKDETERTGIVHGSHERSWGV